MRWKFSIWFLARKFKINRENWNESFLVIFIQAKWRLLLGNRKKCSNWWKNLLIYYYSSLLLTYVLMILIRSKANKDPSKIQIRMQRKKAYLEWELNLDTAIRLNGRFHFNLLSHRCILIPFGQFFPRSNCQRSVGKTLPLETRVHTRQKYHFLDL